MQLIVGVHRMFYCDSSDFSSNDNGDQTMAARQRAALEAVFNYYKARPFCGELNCPESQSAGTIVPATANAVNLMQLAGAQP